MSSASVAVDLEEKLNISGNCSYPIFFETSTKTFVLLIESNKDNVVQSVKLGINSKENPNPFFTVVGYDGDNKTLFNIIDEDIDNALYSVVGYDETGKNLQITWTTHKNYGKKQGAEQNRNQEKNPRSRSDS